MDTLPNINISLMKWDPETNITGVTSQSSGHAAVQTFFGKLPVACKNYVNLLLLQKTSIQIENYEKRKETR